MVELNALFLDRAYVIDTVLRKRRTPGTSYYLTFQPERFI
jgi:hypothetical protein